MRFSIVIPTYNRLERLKLVLYSLDKQEYPLHDLEVLVISDGSTDSTNQFLRNLQVQYQLRPIFQENLGVAVARNSGVQAASGEIIVFMDDDTVPATNFLREHYKTHVEFGSDTVVLGPMLAPPDYQMVPWVSWEQSRLLEQYVDMNRGRWLPTPRQFYTANASLSRKHLLEAGGFDPRFRRAEDVELAYRLENRGLRFVFNPKAVVYHYAERSFESWISIPYAYGVNDVIFTQQKNQAWLLPTVLREYHSRAFLVKMLTKAFLDKPSLSSGAQRIFKGVCLLSKKARLNKLSHLICGGIFNLQYYQGISDALGGRRAFYSEVNAAKLSTSN